MKITSEEKFIFRALFSSERIDKKTLQELDYEKIIKLASSHLILPTLYSNLKEKNYLKFLEKEFVNYLKNIFDLNNERNKEFVREVKEISRLLNKNDINHVFLKSASYLLMKIYKCNGQRMIGDIDILIEENDIQKANLILEKIGYFNINEIDYFPDESHHHIRKVHKKNIFAIEIHKRPLNDPDSVTETVRYLKSKLKVEGVNLMSRENCALYLITNFQFHDKGAKYQRYSIRAMYDYFNIQNGQRKILNHKYGNVINDFFIPFYLFKIDFTGYNIDELNKLNILRFKLKHRFLWYRVIEELIIDIVEKIRILPKRLKKIKRSRKYRSHLKQRIIDKLFF